MGPSVGGRARARSPAGHPFPSIETSFGPGLDAAGSALVTSNLTEGPTPLSVPASGALNDAGAVSPAVFLPLAGRSAILARPASSTRPSFYSGSAAGGKAATKIYHALELDPGGLSPASCVPIMARSFAYVCVRPYDRFDPNHP